MTPFLRVTIPLLTVAANLLPVHSSTAYQILTLCGAIASHRAIASPEAEHFGYQQAAPSNTQRNMLLRVLVSVDIQILPPDKATAESLLRKFSLEAIDSSKSYIVTLDDLDDSHLDDESEESAQLVDSSLQVEQHLVFPWAFRKVNGRLHAQGNTTLSLLLPYQAKKSPVLTARTIVVTLWEDDVYVGGALKPPKLMARRLANLPRMTTNTGSINRGSNAISMGQRTAGPFLLIHLHGATSFRVRPRRYGSDGSYLQGQSAALVSWVIAVGFVALASIIAWQISGQRAPHQHPIREPTRSHLRRAQPSRDRCIGQRNTPELHARIRVGPTSQSGKGKHVLKPERGPPGASLCNGDNNTKQPQRSKPAPSLSSSSTQQARQIDARQVGSIPVRPRAPRPATTAAPCAQTTIRWDAGATVQTRALKSSSITGATQKRSKPRTAPHPVNQATTKAASMKLKRSQHQGKAGTFKKAQRVARDLVAIREEAKPPAFHVQNAAAASGINIKDNHGSASASNPPGTYLIRHHTGAAVRVPIENPRTTDTDKNEPRSQNEPAENSKVVRGDTAKSNRRNNNANEPAGRKVEADARVRQPQHETSSAAAVRAAASGLRSTVLPACATHHSESSKKTRSLRPATKPGPPSSQAAGGTQRKTKIESVPPQAMLPKPQQPAEIVGRPSSRSRRSSYNGNPTKTRDCKKSLKRGEGATPHPEKRAGTTCPPRSERRAEVSHDGSSECPPKAATKPLLRGQVNDNHVISLSSDSHSSASPSPLRQLPNLDSVAPSDTGRGKRRVSTSSTMDNSASTEVRRGRRRVSGSTKSSRKRQSSAHREGKAKGSVAEQISKPKPQRHKRRRLAKADDLLLPDVVPSVSLTSAAQSMRAPVWEHGTKPTKSKRKTKPSR